MTAHLKKAELHCHVEGAAPPALTLTRLQKMTAENGGLSPGRVAAQTLGERLQSELFFEALRRKL